MKLHHSGLRKCAYLGSAYWGGDMIMNPAASRVGTESAYYFNGIRLTK